jgi:hypothetical protein
MVRFEDGFLAGLVPLILSQLPFPPSSGEK